MTIARAYRWWADRYCPKALARRLGVRGFGMVLIGLGWLFIGLGVWQGLPPAPDGAPHLLVPAPYRATAWAGSGILALALSTNRDRDHIALMAAVIMPLVRVGSYLWAWIVHLIPGGHPGYASGWYAAIFQAFLVAFVVLVACIVPVPEPRREDA